MTDIDKLKQEYREKVGGTWNMTHEWYADWLAKELVDARTELIKLKKRDEEKTE